GLTFTLKAAASSGKIESGGDSLAAVFIQVPFATAFTVTAKAEVKTFGGNQSGFGLMVRDDMYLDEKTAVSSNYVTAGGYGTSTGVPMGFARNNGSLVVGTRVNVAAGDMFDLSLARLSQSITANTGSYNYSAESDFDLAVSDSDYVYVCLWVTRGSEVTFSNITFASTDWVQA
ncbi:MAG: hypothetical protein K2N52_05740, partial [Clostridia bacterium]|nr:hypothetical protein [Clostridia bacterium]